MIIGERLRFLREEQKLSQGDVEKRTGLLRCYISRVENGHTVPSVETLEKFARAMDVPMYRLFYEGSGAPSVLKVNLSSSETSEPELSKPFIKVLAKMSQEQRTKLLKLANSMAHKNPRTKRAA